MVSNAREQNKTKTRQKEKVCHGKCKVSRGKCTASCAAVKLDNNLSLFWKSIFKVYFVNTSRFFKQIEETHIIFYQYYPARRRKIAHKKQYHKLQVPSVSGFSCLSTLFLFLFCFQVSFKFFSFQLHSCFHLYSKTITTN